MGCWNGTCAISNLPIFFGEDVKLIITERNAYFNKKTYCGAAFSEHDTIYKPIFLQLDAQYNDYGSVENITENWNYKIICSKLIRKTTKIKVDFDKLIEEPKLYDILYGIERGKQKG